MNPAVETFHLNKRFGNVVAVNDLSFSAQRGDIVGLIGPNGSGKSVTLKLLAGLAIPTSGGFALFGNLDPYNRTSCRSRVAYLSQTMDFPPNLTVRQVLAFCSSLYKDWDDSFQSDLVKRFELPMNRYASELSLGVKLRLSLVCSLCQNAELLLLDEPSGNLDPIVRTEFFSVLAEYLERKSPTVLIATHIFSDLERIAERFIVLANGAKLHDESMENLRSRYRRVQVVFDKPINDNFTLKGVINERKSGRVYEAILNPYVEEAVSRACAESGASFDVYPVPLDELFVSLCASGVAK